MELIPSQTSIRIGGSHRLIPSRYPTTGILDEIARPDDLRLIWDLESWTNDRINDQFGILNRLPDDEWVLGVPNATVIMAAFCHPKSGGGRFNTSTLGAWYASFELETAIQETAYHRYKEFVEVGRLDGAVSMRQYLADLEASFHDVREASDSYGDIYNPESYKASQEFGELLRKIDSNGILYNSVRTPGGHCVVVFKPRLIRNVRQGAHFHYTWNKDGVLKVRRV